MSAELARYKNHYSGFAIVTDGLWRKSLSVIRSLGKANYHVTVLGNSWCTTGFWSRYATRRERFPTADSNETAFIQALTSLLDEYNDAEITPVVFAMEDASMKCLVKMQHSEPTVSFAALLPPPDALAIAADKALTMKHAADLGIPCPHTAIADNPTSAVTLTNELEKGSFVAKPRVGVGSSGVLYGTHLKEEDWAQHIRNFGSLVIQERIPEEGEALGASLLIDENGKTIAAVAHRRLKQYPVSGGPSTDRITIDNPELIANSEHLLQSLKWRGIAMVEWKLDPRDNVPKLLEINPRFWGSLELAVRAGVDFPLIYAQASRMEPFSPVISSETGVRCRWMIPGDILRYLSSQEREPLSQFFSGLPSSAEEWDPKDLRGALAACICTGLLACNPRYWRYVRRK